jgi:hypothetical protein
VLRVTADRLADELLCVHLPYPSLDPQGICRWILSGLAAQPLANSLFGFEAFVTHLREVESTLLLLVDEIDVMPLETVAWLGQRVRGSKGELRLAATALPGPRCDQRLALLGPSSEAILLERPMHLEESRRYVQERLDRSDAPRQTRKRLGTAVVSELHERSGGNPRELHRLATEFLRC